MDPILANAIIAFRARQAGLQHPAGRSDRKGRWWPDPDEAQPCCGHIRTPSRAWPWSLYKHCHGAEHVALLYDIRPTVIRSALAKEAATKRPTRTSPTDICSTCGASWTCAHLDLEDRTGLTPVPAERARMELHTAGAPVK